MLCFWADWTVTPKSSDQLHTEGHPDERVEADLRLVIVAESAPKVVVELLPTGLAIHEREQVQITDVMELCAVAEPAVESALTRDPGLITVSPVQIGGPCLATLWYRPAVPAAMLARSVYRTPPTAMISTESPQNPAAVDRSRFSIACKYSSTTRMASDC